MLFILYYNTIVFCKFPYILYLELSTLVTWINATISFFHRAIEKFLSISMLYLIIFDHSLIYYHNDFIHTLANTIIQGHDEGKRKICRPKRNWIYDVNEWIGMSTRFLFDITKDCYIWKKLFMTS